MGQLSMSSNVQLSMNRNVPLLMNSNVQQSTIANALPPTNSSVQLLMSNSVALSMNNSAQPPLLRSALPLIKLLRISSAQLSTNSNAQPRMRLFAPKVMVVMVDMVGIAAIAAGAEGDVMWRKKMRKKESKRAVKERHWDCYLEATRTRTMVATRANITRGVQSLMAEDHLMEEAMAEAMVEAVPTASLFLRNHAGLYLVKAAKM